MRTQCLDSMGEFSKIILLEIDFSLADILRISETKPFFSILEEQEECKCLSKK